MRTVRDRQLSKTAWRVLFLLLPAWFVISPAIRSIRHGRPALELVVGGVVALSAGVVGWVVASVVCCSEQLRVTFGRIALLLLPPLVLALCVRILPDGASENGVMFYVGAVLLGACRPATGGLAPRTMRDWGCVVGAALAASLIVLAELRVG